MSQAPPSCPAARGSHSPKNLKRDLTHNNNGKNRKEKVANGEYIEIGSHGKDYNLQRDEIDSKDLEHGEGGRKDFDNNCRDEDLSHHNSKYTKFK